MWALPLLHCVITVEIPDKSSKTNWFWWIVFLIFGLATAMAVTHVPLSDYGRSFMVYTRLCSIYTSVDGQCRNLNFQNLQHEPTCPREEDSSTDNGLSTAGNTDDPSATKTTWGRNFNLPIIRRDLIGREQEMEELTGYLRDEAVEVVTLYSGPGYGKTMMSQHIGHREIEAGTDVYYISVNVLPNVERLVDKLINISGLELNPHDDMFEKLKSWTKNINKISLLILDDVYGTLWLHDSAIANFRKNFTEILVQYSRDFQKKLKILITSQLEVKPRRCEFRSVNLEPPSLPTSVTEVKPTDMRRHHGVTQRLQVCTRTCRNYLIFYTLHGTSMQTDFFCQSNTLWGFISP